MCTTTNEVKLRNHQIKIAKAKGNRIRQRNIVETEVGTHIRWIKIERPPKQNCSIRRSKIAQPPKLRKIGNVRGPQLSKKKNKKIRSGP